MNKTFNLILKAVPVAMGASFMSLQGAIAAPQDNVTKAGVAAPQADSLEQLRRRQELKRFDANLGDDQGMSQVTSVSELRDVSPDAWAFEALQSLVERYGCIVGYPDRTFRGNRALSRWEFAAGLNACMNVMERLIQENVAVLREDIDKLKRLMQEFEAELAALGARVDNLESRVSFLEDHQFSTTTKLNGLAVFAIADQWGGQKAINWREQDRLNQGRRSAPADVDEIATFSSRVRLNFDTSFTGKDLLKTRLQAGSVPSLSGPTGTNMARLSFDGSSPDNNVDLNKLWYRFPIGSNIKAYVGPRGLALDDVFQTYNPYLASGDTGSLSRFNRYNPFVNRGPEGAGASLEYAFSKEFNIVATYLADDGDASSPTAGRGFFGGSYSTGAQINWKPTKDLGLGVSYLHKYYRRDAVNLTSSTGSSVASNPFYGTPTSVDSYNLQGNWRINKTFNLSAWGGYAEAKAHGGSRDGLGADLWTWNAALSILDLGKEGAVLSFSGGLMPFAPYVGSLSGDLISNDRSAPYIIEAQYQFPINKNIQITPGVYAILSPEANSNNSTIWVGVLRTTFKF